MKLYIDILENLNIHFPKELAINMVLNSLSSSYQEFIMNYNMNNMDKTLIELRDMLKTAEASMLKTCSSNPTAPILAIGHNIAKRKKVSHPKGKGKTKWSHLFLLPVKGELETLLPKILGGSEEEQSQRDWNLKYIYDWTS